MPNYVEYIKVGTGESWPVRDADAQARLAVITDLIYPVGSIYMSVETVSPDEKFGGTWEQIQGRFLLAASNDYPLGSTGGEKEHTLTINEMPEHGHRARFAPGTQEGVTSGIAWASGGMISALDTPVSSCIEYAGGGQPHNNMPPYLAVYMWKRIS